MTWSYNTSLSANQDKVRFYAGDTVSTAAITLSDEEILGAITMAGGARAAAALVCEHLANRYATEGQRLQDDLGQQIDYGERAKFFSDRATQLRSRSAIAALPYAGGISLADKQVRELDSDRVEPAFTKALHDDREADLSDEES
ncbi:MAG: hypothetical protein ACEQSH_00930 [Bacteroidia bacterium]